MYQVITLQGGSRHLNLCQAEGFQHQRCLFLGIVSVRFILVEYYSNITKSQNSEKFENQNIHSPYSNSSIDSIYSCKCMNSDSLPPPTIPVCPHIHSPYSSIDSIYSCKCMNSDSFFILYPKFYIYWRDIHQLSIWLLQYWQCPGWMTSL